MSTIPQEEWFRNHVERRREEFGSAPDLVGRPWYQHFERVALRLIFRDQSAGRDQIEAALYHDALMAGGAGKSFLRELGLTERAICIIELTTPPSHGNNFRDAAASGPADNAIYLNYIRDLIATGDTDAIQMKLADIRDTIDSLQMSARPILKLQLRERYIPSSQLLEDAVETIADE